MIGYPNEAGAIHARCPKGPQRVFRIVVLEQSAKLKFSFAHSGINILKKIFTQ